MVEILELDPAWFLGLVLVAAPLQQLGFYCEGLPLETSAIGWSHLIRERVSGRERGRQSPRGEEEEEEEDQRKAEDVDPSLSVDCPRVDSLDLINCCWRDALRVRAQVCVRACARGGGISARPQVNSLCVYMEECAHGAGGERRG